MAILGCIAREGLKMEQEKRIAFNFALEDLTYSLISILKAQDNPTDIFLNTRDYLGNVSTVGGEFSRVQEIADVMAERIVEPIEVAFVGPFGEITSEYIESLPDFHDKIKIKFL